MKEQKLASRRLIEEKNKPRFGDIPDLGPHIVLSTMCSCLFVSIAFNHDLDHALLALSDQLERIFGLLEGVSVAHQSLHVNLATGYQVYCRGVAAGAISDRTTDGEIANTSSGDREHHILLTNSSQTSTVNNRIQDGSPLCPFQPGHTSLPYDTAEPQSGYSSAPPSPQARHPGRHQAQTPP